MEKIERSDAPDWLEKKWKEWGEAWKGKYRETGRSGDFRWRQYKKKGYDDLLHDLSEMTKAHCSFCDAYPMGCRIPPTIEHFRPKTGFPLLAYKWDNLFLCCGLCQEKGDKFHKNLLKPDDEDYSFDAYFEIRWDTGELTPNEDAPREDQERAEYTIRLYRLNDHGKPDDRLEELRKFNDTDIAEIDRFSYRFFLTRGRLS